MKTLKKHFSLLFLFSFFFISTYAQNSYQLSIETWHKQRLERLISESGWINLSGLFWLQNGYNSFGTDTSGNIVFPENKCRKKMGHFVLNNGVVTLVCADSADITINDTIIKNKIIYDETTEKTLLLKHKSLQWFVIKRGNKYGIRLRDLQSENLKRFKGIERFAVDEKWNVNAILEAPEKIAFIDVTDVLGNVNKTPYAGKVHFEIDGIKYALDATKEGEEMFIVFADETSGITTYGSGRFLYASMPKDDNKVFLDFNKAYNPPCAFTAFATCPLPLKQNFLNVKIEAGEKSFEGH
jgi:uncharacterized protein (DUF1684 family)